MANYRYEEIKCEACGNIFEYENYFFIRVPEDNELKQDLVSRKLYKHRCPNCNHETYMSYPLIYVDDDKKYVIVGDEYESYLATKDELKESFEGYNLFNAYRDVQLSEMIRLIDKDYSPYACELLKYVAIRKFEKYFKKNRLPYTVLASMAEVINDELSIEVVYKDINDKLHAKQKVISYHSYNKAYDFLDTKYQGSDISIFNYDYIRKLNILNKNENIDEIKSCEYEFLLVSTPSDDTMLMFVQSFNNGKFKEEDMVVSTYYDKHDNCILIPGHVRKVLHMTDYEYPYEINDLPVATYKRTDLNLNTIMKSDEELGNVDFIDVLTRNPKLPEDYSKIFDSNVIVPMVLEQSDELNIDSNNQMDTNFKLIVRNDKRYLVVYSDQKEVKANDVAVKLVYSFNDMLKIFFYEGTLDGIVFNPESDNVVFELNKIFDLITNRIMSNGDLMKVFVNNAKKEEIDFIGEENFNLIRSVYTTDIGLNKIREKLNLTEEKAGFMLSNGYGRIKRIIKSQYLN